MKGPAFLDTNVAIMWAFGDRSLTGRTVETIAGHPRAIISSLTIAEVEIKAMNKKFSDLDLFKGVIHDSGIEIESFDDEAANQLSRFPTLIGHDPFDRLILSQAASHRNSRLFTTDSKLASLGLDWVVHVTK